MALVVAVAAGRRQKCEVKSQRQLKDLDHLRDLLDAAIGEGELLAKQLIDASVLIEDEDRKAAVEALTAVSDRIWFLDAKCRRLELRRGIDDLLVETLNDYRRHLQDYYRYLRTHCGPDSGYDEELSNELMNGAEAAHMDLIRAAVPIVGTYDPD